MMCVERSALREGGRVPALGHESVFSLFYCLLHCMLVCQREISLLLQPRIYPNVKYVPNKMPSNAESLLRNIRELASIC